MELSKITKQDFEQFWTTFKAVAEAQETYSFDPDISYADAFELWCILPQVTCVSKENRIISGLYYLKPNAAGPGSHVCNCGYMVAPEYQGRGVAKILCKHSQQMAIELGYTAMQFNAVVSTNEVAVHLWKSLGYSIIGTIPNGYRHKKLGFVDSYIMYKQLIT
ncbi:MAG: GNAT family N-acetyltransferase [Desulfobacteraceae bacterium]|nr:GNAT family N-acetyltransferase [Desulfobacteraceae bacterium]